jgi:tungstate transport system substrate-binding protein
VVKISRSLRVAIQLALSLLAATFVAQAQNAAPKSELLLASTTSTQDSGLFGAILPAFEKASGIQVKVVAVGTGQALDLARRGDADALLVHDRAAEDAFVAQGFGLARHLVMANDFVIVGPKADPAAIRGQRDAAAALAKIASASAKFASRADRSGTHAAELRLWKAAGIEPAKHSGSWYLETGSGMGATLNTAAGLEAYVLTDRATWLAFKNPRDLVLLCEGDPRLLNPYGAIQVNPAKHPHVHAKEAKAFIDWLLSDAGQQAIAAFKVSGVQLFTPVRDMHDKTM